jgi:hypothetical protein
MDAKTLERERARVYQHRRNQPDRSISAPGPSSKEEGDGSEEGRGKKSSRRRAPV